MVSLIARLGLSSWFLDGLYPYAAEGGAWFQKIHPGTYVLMLVFGIAMAHRGPLTFVADIRGRQPATFGFCVVLLMMMLANLVRFGTGGMAYLIDTFLSAIMAAALSLQLRDGHRRLLFGALVTFLAANSMVGVAEYIGGFNLLEVNKWFGFHRATAFLGHPLANGLITATVIVPILNTTWDAKAKAALVGLMLVGLFCFGARGATGVTLIALTGYLAWLPFTGTNARIGSAYFVIATACLLALTVGISTLLATELGSGIAQRLTLDASAETRFDSLVVLRVVGMQTLLVGMDQDAYTAMLGYGGVVEVVENFWIVMILQFGLPLVALFLFALVRMLREWAASGGWVSFIAAAAFLVAASTNNSLSSKTPALMICAVALSFGLKARRMSVTKPAVQPVVTA